MKKIIVTVLALVLIAAGVIFILPHGGKAGDDTEVDKNGVDEAADKEKQEADVPYEKASDDTDISVGKNTSDVEKSGTASDT